MNNLIKQQLIEEGIKATIRGRKANIDFCVSLMLMMTNKTANSKDINEIMSSIISATKNNQLSLEL